MNSKEKIQPEYALVFENKGKKLFVQDLSEKMFDRETGNHVQSPVATWGGESAAIIDRRAYEILRTVCLNDQEKLNKYLNVILEFEINHSNDQSRHENRLPIEQEILDILQQGGYFEQ